MYVETQMQYISSRPWNLLYLSGRRCLSQKERQDMEMDTNINIDTDTDSSQNLIHFNHCLFCSLKMCLKY